MSDVTDLIGRAQFLCDRLDELEWHDGNLEDGLRDYMGHVDPAHARLKAALERLTRPADDVVPAAWQWRVMDEDGEYSPWALCYGEPAFVGIEKEPLYPLTTIKQTDAVEAERELVVLREVGRLALSSPDSKTCCQIEQIVREFLVKRATEIATVGAK